MTKSTRQPEHGKSGFTIVETLIAVTILMIAIAGPLVIASKALTAALDARSQMIASQLAQETIEMIKNTKDDNIYNLSAGVGSATSWLSSISDASNPCTGTTPATGACGAAPVNGGVVRCGAAGSIYNACRLYLSNDGYQYGSANGAALTPFTRYFYLSNIVPGGSGAPGEALVTVVVGWTTGSLANQITLQDVMSSVSRQ